MGPDIVLAIAANKSDLEKERSVPESVVAAYAAEIGASCFSTSAKTGEGLERAFLDIAKRCLERQHASLTREASIGTSSLGESLSALTLLPALLSPSVSLSGAAAAVLACSQDTC